jgi:hypothetical protein
MLGPSDWDDEDLLTVAEASGRLAHEINDSRRRIAAAEEAEGHEARETLAAERVRLADLLDAAKRIKDAQANAPG